MESSIEIEEQAAAWLSSRDGGQWTEAGQLEFTNWLAASTAHRVAYLRLEAAWEEALRLQALNTGDAQGRVPSPSEWYPTTFSDSSAGSPWRARRAGMIGVAAGILLVFVAAIAWRIHPTGPVYATPIGGTASVPLGEGSQVTLDTDTEVRVVVTSAERRVNLNHGEAFFDVAPDAHRPFIVQAGDKRVVAVGTRFSVRREGARLRVVVTEGAVRIEVPGEPPELATPLRAGTIAHASGTGVVRETLPLPQAQEMVSWRTGMLVFHDTTLVESIAEFNRYTRRRIVIEDPQLAQMRVSGSFRSTNVEEFLQLLERGFPLRIEEHAEEIVLRGDDPG